MPAETPHRGPRASAVALAARMASSTTALRVVAALRRRLAPGPTPPGAPSPTPAPGRGATPERRAGARRGRTP
jgi:hypothetical protein